MAFVSKLSAITQEMAYCQSILKVGNPRNLVMSDFYCLKNVTQCKALCILKKILKTHAFCIKYL